MTVLSKELLRDYEGKSMREICPYGFDATNKNHCAHFVGHALRLDFGMTCARLRGKPNATGAANVRVHEIFDRAPDAHEVLECPTTGTGLVFVSERRNFHGSPTQMRNVPKKHIGIAIDGVLWHYSNPRNRVVRQPVGEFLYHYPRQTNALWWGALPATTRPTRFAMSSL